MLGSVGKPVTDFAPISGKSVTDLGKSVTDFKEICPRVWGNLPPILRKSVTDFGEIRHRLWENLSPTLGKSVTDFGETRHRLWEAPFSRKISVFGKFIGKNMFRFWEKHASFLAKTCSVLGEHMPHFGEQAPSLGQSGPVLVKKRLGLGVRKVTREKRSGSARRPLFLEPSSECTTGLCLSTETCDQCRSNHSRFTLPLPALQV